MPNEVTEYIKDDDCIDPLSWPSLTELIKNAPEMIEYEDTEPEPLF